MKRGGLWIPSACMLVAAVAWAGCSSDNNNGGGGSGGVGGYGGSLTDAGKGGTDGGKGGTGGTAGTGGTTDGGIGGTDGGTAGTSGAAGTDGGTAGTAGSAGTDGGTAGSDAGTDGGIAECKGDWPSGAACGACLENKCCDVLAACADVTDCINCLSDPNPSSTACTSANQNAAQALYDCANTNCNSECLSTGPAPTPACDAPATAPSGGTCVTIGGKNECNPVTNEGCTAAGSACDFNQAGDGYTCYPAPNTQALCQQCSSSIGFCQAGMTCFGQCMKYCCTNADCGSGTCDKSADLQLPGGVGVCVLQGDGGAGDAGTDAAPTDASTD